MTRWVCAGLIAASLVGPAAIASIARGEPGHREVIDLPLNERQCQALIARGAPFALGGPDTAPGCGVAAGDPDLVRLPFDARLCRRLVGRGAPFFIGNPNDAPACFVTAATPTTSVLHHGRS